MDNYWLASRWRPIMAIVYSTIVLFDFILAPVLWGLLIYLLDGDVIQWNPLTLEDGGLFHVAMGAVLGVSAWTRGQEKLAILETKLEEASNNNKNKGG